MTGCLLLICHCEEEHIRFAQCKLRDDKSISCLKLEIASGYRPRNDTNYIATGIWIKNVLPGNFSSSWPRLSTQIFP